MVNSFNEVKLLATDVSNNEPNIGHESILRTARLDRVNDPEKQLQITKILELVI